jgi:hypothetical protein
VSIQFSGAKREPTPIIPKREPTPIIPLSKTEQSVSVDFSETFSAKREPTPIIFRAQVA